MNDTERQIRKVGGVGILTPDDIESLNAARLNVLDLMADQRWHSRSEIIQAANGQSEGLRRMRELRELSCVRRIERYRYGGREFFYRLVFRR